VMKFLVLLAGLCGYSMNLSASAQERLKDATEVFHDIMATPDKGIPEELLERAQCVVIVPGLKKGAFIVGGEFGKGFVTCRKQSGQGWGPPAAIRMEGGSFGFQIGGQDTDVVMLVMNKHGVDELFKSKFTLGGDASIAAGPVGRHASAQTDAYMTAEILSWSRSKGLFAGIALKGATLRPDEGDNKELYGRKMTTREVMSDASLTAPAAASGLTAELNRYSPHRGYDADRQTTK
jgi:lipid-binding SYLF domain-containing protein